MAHNTPHRAPWYLPPQGSFSRCCSSQIWLGPSKYTKQMQLWSHLHRRPHHDICKRWLHHPSHKEVRDITNSLLSGVCRNTSTEPTLQPLSGKSFQHASAIKSDEARADIKATCFWTHGQDTFFDVRVFCPKASSYINRNLARLYKHHKIIKKREYC